MARKDSWDMKHAVTNDDDMIVIPDAAEGMKATLDYLLRLVASENSGNFALDEYKTTFGVDNAAILKRLIDSISSIKRDCSSWQNEYTKLQSVVASLQKQLDTQSTINSDLDKKNKELNDNTRSTSTRLLQTEEQLKQVLAREDTHIVQWKEKEAKITDLESQLAALTLAQSKLTEAMTKDKKEAEAKIRDLENILATTKRDSNKLAIDKDTRIKELSGSLDSLMREKHSAETKTRDLDTQLATAKSATTRLTQQIDTMTKDKNDMESRLNKQCVDRDSKIKELSDALVKERRDAETKLKDLDSARTKTDKDKSDSEAKIRELSKHISDRDNKIKELTSVLEGMKRDTDRTIKDLQLQVGAANAKQNNDNRVKDLQQQLDASRKNCASLQTQLSTQMGSSNREIANMQQQLEEVNQQLHDLTIDEGGRNSLVCLKDFRVGDLMFFLNCGGPRDLPNYYAINDGNPYYYLSDDTRSIWREKRTRPPSYVLGNAVSIEDHVATAEYNPFQLRLNTTFHVVTVALLEHTAMVIEPGEK